MKEIKSIRVRLKWLYNGSDQLNESDVKLVLKSDEKGRHVTLNPSIYPGMTYTKKFNNIDDDSIIGMFLDSMIRYDKYTSFEIIQDPWSDTPPKTRSYGNDRYFLNNGCGIYIPWTENGVDVGGRKWSDDDGNELDQTSGGESKDNIRRVLDIISPDGSSDGNMIFSDSGLIIKKESDSVYKEFKSSTITDMDIIQNVIEYWKEKVPNYSNLGLCEPSNEFCNIIEYKSPLGDPSPESEESIPTEESTQGKEEKVKLNVVLPEDLELRIKEDIESLKVYIGDIPPLPGGFVFQDDFYNLDELDPEFSESEFIGDDEVNEAVDEPYMDPDSSTDNNSPTSPVTGSPISPSKLYSSSSNGKLYINKRKGIAGHRLNNVLTDLQLYLRNNGFPGTTLKTNGIIRDLAAAAATSNPKRVAGSLHGAGLAIDVKFNIPGFTWTGIGHNKNLAKSTKLNKTIYNWVLSQGDLTWGGQWGKKSGTESEKGIVKGWGITEYHHFEIRSSKISQYWEPYVDDLNQLGFTPNELVNITNLGKLYTKILRSEGIV